MAILNSIPGLEVSVVVDGNPIHEYPDEEEAVRLASLPEGVKTVPVFIDATSEKEFVIRLSVNDDYQTTSATVTFDIYVDGHPVDGHILCPVTASGSFKDGTPIMNQILNVEGCAFALPGDLFRESIKKFKFSAIVGNDDILKDPTENPSIEEAGKIIVHAFRIGDTQALDQERINPSGDKIKLNNSHVDEKVLKGEVKNHFMSFGASYTLEKNYYDVSFLDGRSNPFATFKFKYRSLDALKSLLVIRRASPEAEVAPGPLPRRSLTPDLDNLSAEDRERVCEFLRSNLRRDNARIKNEDDDQARIKKESSDNLGGVSREHAIDLTISNKTVKREGTHDLLEDATPAKKSKVVNA